MTSSEDTLINCLPGYENTLTSFENTLINYLSVSNNNILLAIVGWRNFNNYQQFCKYVKEWILLFSKTNNDYFAVVVEELTKWQNVLQKKNEITMKVLYPNWKLYSGL